MRFAMRVVCGIALGLCAPALSSAQNTGAAEGFGGLSLSNIDSIAPNLGGTLTFELTPSIHVVAEGGRMGNVLPPLSSSIFSLAGTGIQASALYGEGGVRFLPAPSSHVTPYVEATAGIARLDISSRRLGGVANGITSAALGLLGRTGPVAGVGGGVLFRAGPVVFDAGYRYKKLFPPSLLEAALGLGQDLRSQQVRVGIGVRF